MVTSDPYLRLRRSVFGLRGYSASRNSSVFYGGIYFLLAFDMAVTVRLKRLVHDALVCKLTQSLRRFHHRCHVALLKRRFVHEH
jgi:hypothetical protein